MILDPLLFLNYIYFKLNKLKQLLLRMSLVHSDIDVRGSLTWEEIGIPRGNWNTQRKPEYPEKTEIPREI